ncbi:MAG: head-tail connector protein [Pseudomonadota bacterium]
MAVTTLVPPSGLPVTLASIKQHLRLADTDEDNYLLELADGATTYVESHIRQCLVERTVRQYVDGSSVSRIVELECWPVKTIVGVTVYDINGDPATLADGDHVLRTSSDPATFSLKPSLGLSGVRDGMEIDYLAGYGETSLDIPSNMVRAIHLVIAHWYEFRGAGISELQHSLPHGIERLLAPTRRVRI